MSEPGTFEDGFVSDEITLEELDRVIDQRLQGDPVIRPVLIDGKPYYRLTDLLLDNGLMISPQSVEPRERQRD